MIADETFIQRIDSQPAFRELIDRNPEKIVVVKFFSNQCQACKKIAPRYRQYARDFSTDSSQFEFAEIEVLQNRNLMKELGVKRMPSVHFYAGELGKVEDLLCGPKKIPILKETLTRYAMYGVGAANHMVNDAVVSTETSHDEVPSYSRSTVVGKENDLLRVENAIAASIREAREALQVANDTHSHSELYSR